jgi:hypothetical protein
MTVALQATTMHAVPEIPTGKTDPPSRDATVFPIEPKAAQQIAFKRFTRATCAASAPCESGLPRALVAM